MSHLTTGGPTLVELDEPGPFDTWLPDRVPAAAAPSAVSSRLTPRFVDLGVLATGGMGEIHRVVDEGFNRTLALKVVRPDLAPSPRLLSRFVAEAQVTAQLQHPGIVPVHEMGTLPDGRRYFTMREVKGRDLGHVIGAVHAARTPTGWGVADGHWSFRRMIDAFHKVCETVAYAHSRGVIHRDLKPENVRVGDFGEVLVLDWGIARVVGAGAAEEVVTVRSADATHATLHGAVAGTPAYMPPEQAAGDTARQGFPADVYALGACLYEMLVGHPPYTGADALAKVLAGPPAPLPERPDLPEPLRQICAKAMAREPSERFPTARELADAVGAWLDGAARRDPALALLSQAQEQQRKAEGLRRRAEARREDADQMLRTVRPTAGVEHKRTAWAAIDEAARLERGAEVLEAKATELASAALAQCPELGEAHAFLADHYQRAHAAAEAQGDLQRAERWRTLLQAHDTGRHRRYLLGRGALTLVTDPPDAEVFIHRFHEVDRRLVLEPAAVSLRAPIRALELPIGRYLLDIRAPGRAPVRYPVQIVREGHWDGVAPGASAPTPIRLPLAEELDPDDVYVPAGWFGCGTNPSSPNVPRERVWVDAFVMRRFPVTHREYLDFLNDLHRGWREADAQRFAPIGPCGAARGDLYTLGRVGAWRLTDESFAARPVVMVDWTAACAFAAWKSMRAGTSWWLPTEVEFEKAARGVDGRLYPWGDFLDPTFACMLQSHGTRPLPAAVGEFPLDESPYGVRGLAGNARTWCRDPYAATTAAARRTPSEAALSWRAVRGGSWMATQEACRADHRIGLQESDRLLDVGLRLVRPLR